MPVHHDASAALQRAMVEGVRDRLIATRLIAVGVAVSIAVPAIGAFSTVAADPTVDSIIHLRSLLDSEAFAHADLFGVLLWAIAPIAAAIAAWPWAPRAVDRVSWTGTAMGTSTYVIACLLGVLMEVGAAMRTIPFDLSGAVLSIGFGVAFALPALYPLLIVCIGSGIAWSAVIGRLMPSTDVATPRDSAIPPLVGGILVLLGVGWLAVVWILGTTAGVHPGSVID
jgi:hypothetical protein